MRKYFSIFVIFILLALSMLFLTSCSTDEMDISFNIDTGDIDIVVPNNLVDTSYVPTIDAIKVNNKDDYTNIKISLSESEEEDVSVFISSVKNEFAKIVPSFADIKDKFNIDIIRNYFGSSISGTTYYTINVKNETGIDIPVKFISEKTFLLNGSSAVKNNDLFEYSLTFENGSDIVTHELQYMRFYIEAIKITVDISDDTPSVEYEITHTLKNIDANLIATELRTYGMHVTYCKDNVAMFSETYKTNNDFQYVFPMQLYSVFGIVNTIEYKYGAFFTANGEFEFNLVNVPIENIKMVIVGQENTQFDLMDGDTHYTEKSNSYTFTPKSGMIIKASYSNARLFATFTSLFTIIAIIFVMFCMFYIVKKRNRGGLYNGH